MIGDQYNPNQKNWNRESSFGPIDEEKGEEAFETPEGSNY